MCICQFTIKHHVSCEFFMLKNIPSIHVERSISILQIDLFWSLSFFLNINLTFNNWEISHENINLWLLLKNKRSGHENILLIFVHGNILPHLSDGYALSGRL